MESSQIPTCKAHSQPNEYFSLNSLIRNSTIQYACQQCLFQYKLDPQDYQKYNVQDFPLIEGYSMSFPGLPSVNSIYDPSSQGFRMDFMNSQVEHIIFNSKASGCLPKCLAFIPEKNLLIVGDRNGGRIDLWQIGDKIEYSSHILLNQLIQMIKYVDISEDKKYLFVVSFDQIHIFNMVGEKPISVRTLFCSKTVSDLIFIPHRNQFIALQRIRRAIVWGLQNFERIQDIELDFHGVRGEAYSGAYIKEDDALVVEDTEGVCIINLKTLVGVDGKTTALTFRTQKQESGMCYLPVAKQFMLRTTSDQTYIIDVKNFTPRLCYETFSMKTAGGAFDYIMNQNESQILCNSNFQHYYVYNQGKYSVFDIKNLIECTGAIAVIPHQSRFIIADSISGKLVIFRSNTAKSFRYNQFNIESTIVRTMPSPVAKTFTITPIPLFKIDDVKIMNRKSIKKNITIKREQSKIKAPKISKTKSKFRKNHPTPTILKKKKREKFGRKSGTAPVEKLSSPPKSKCERNVKSKKVKTPLRKTEKIILVTRISKRNKGKKEEVGIVLE